VPIDRLTRSHVPDWLAKNSEFARRYRIEESFERVYMPRAAQHEVPVDAFTELYEFAAKAIGNVPLLYLEFGVYGGRSMSRMVERFPHPGARFVGFDSFEGLPEDWAQAGGRKERGFFSTGGQIPTISDPRVSFEKGWFQDTLPPFLAAHDLSGTTPILVHYDADLYSSTLFVLCMLWPATRGYYFIFDEFMGDELLALDDFSRAFPVELEFLCSAGEYPVKVFGRMRRISS